MNRVVMKLLSDRSGRVLIHWFIHDDQGPVETPANAVMTAMGPLKLGGVRGRIACMPSLDSVTPTMVNGISYPVPHSDDVRAVTCPACSATKEFWEMKKRLAEILETAMSADDYIRMTAAGVNP